jgi:putative addiction module component (TIGR02574 family)
MILDSLPEVNRLSPAEKLQLASEIWDDLAGQPDRVPMSAAQLEELERRMEEHRRAPDQVTTWEAIKQRISEENRRRG